MNALQPVIATAIGPEITAEAARLNALHGEHSAAELIALASRELFPGRTALVTSFGATAVLLHLAASVDPTIPVIFVDTLRLFPETLAYRDALVERLGLRDVRIFSPGLDDEAQLDPLGALFAIDPDTCCGFRKVEPLGARWTVSTPGSAAASASRRTPARAAGVRGRRARIKLNPLANWSASELLAYIRRSTTCRRIPWLPRAIPPSAARPAPRRSRRARIPAPAVGAAGKTECGIHLGAGALKQRGA